LPLPEAAQKLGSSMETLRRHLKQGKIKGERRPTPQGFAWWVCVGDLTTLSPPGDMTTQAVSVAEVGELGRLVRELKQDVVEKAEAAAMWQARAEMLSFQLQGAQETIRMLEAPKHQANEAVLAPDSPQEPLETVAGREVRPESSEEHREPWWRRFWQLVSV
jgi:hypothetical protein